jgi:hypothetical protein
MKLTTSLRNTLTLIGCLAASSALAIPNIKQCSSYVSWSSGFVSNATIIQNNAPHPLSDSTARTSATGICYGLWLSSGGNSLSYANAGNIVNVWPTAGGYNYQCLKCAGSSGPGWQVNPVDAQKAIQVVREAIREGTVVGVKRQFTFDADQVLEVYYEVDVEIGEHVARARVDARTGQVDVPEELTAQEVVPENACK